MALQERDRRRRVKLSAHLQTILDRALEGRALRRGDCVDLLKVPEDSLEASWIKAVADAVSRRRFRNAGILMGQIGVESAPCPGDCRFCGFAEGHATLPPSGLSLDEIRKRTHAFADRGDLYALFLMMMHDFDPDRLVEVVGCVRREMPSHSRIVVNIGDFDLAVARRLKDAGVSGAYHVCRLREGTDTSLDPEARKATFRAIRDAGLDLYTCCEPVGPEHSAEELADQIFLGIEYGCFQHAAMRRTRLPGAPLACRGQITERRLAQVVAVVTLATSGCAETRGIAVHEPNLLGLAAGANAVYAETGANPRDAELDTAGHRGADMAVCRKMLYESGFASVRRGDGREIGLDIRYLEEVERTPAR